MGATDAASGNSLGEIDATSAPILPPAPTAAALPVCECNGLSTYARTMKIFCFVLACVAFDLCAFVALVVAMLL